MQNAFSGGGDSGGPVFFSNWRLGNNTDANLYGFDAAGVFVGGVKDGFAYTTMNSVYQYLNLDPETTLFCFC